MFCKKGVLRNFAKFTGKPLHQSLYFNKNAGLRLAILLKKELWHRCFPVNFATFLRTPIFKEHFWWLLLSINIRRLNFHVQININLEKTLKVDGQSRFSIYSTLVYLLISSKDLVNVKTGKFWPKPNSHVPLSQTH